MSVEQTIYGAVVGLCGGRVYPGKLPENVDYPAIDYTFLPIAPDQSQNGYSRTSRIRFGIWGRTFDDVINTEQSLLAILANSALYHSLFDGDLDANDAETGLYRRIADFIVRGN